MFCPNVLKILPVMLVFLYCFCLFEVAPRLPWCELRAQQLEQLVVQHTRLQQAMLVFGQ